MGRGGGGVWPRSPFPQGWYSRLPAPVPVCPCPSHAIVPAGTPRSLRSPRVASQSPQHPPGSRRTGRCCTPVSCSPSGTGVSTAGGGRAAHACHRPQPRSPNRFLFQAPPRPAPPGAPPAPHPRRSRPLPTLCCRVPTRGCGSRATPTRTSRDTTRHWGWEGGPATVLVHVGLHVSPGQTPRHTTHGTRGVAAPLPGARSGSAEPSPGRGVLRGATQGTPCSPFHLPVLPTHPSSALWGSPVLPNAPSTLCLPLPLPLTLPPSSGSPHPPTPGKPQAPPQAQGCQALAPSQGKCCPPLETSGESPQPGLREDGGGGGVQEPFPWYRPQNAAFFVKCVNGVFLPCEHFLHPETCGSCHQEPVPSSPAPWVSVPNPMVSLSPQAPTPSDGATVPSRRWCYCPRPWWMPSPVGSHGHRPCPHATSSPTRSQCHCHPRLSPRHYRNPLALFVHGAPLLWGGWQQKRGAAPRTPGSSSPPRLRGSQHRGGIQAAFVPGRRQFGTKTSHFQGGKAPVLHHSPRRGDQGGHVGSPAARDGQEDKGRLRHGSRTGSGVFDLERFVHLLALTAEPLRGRGGYRMPVAPPPNCHPPLQTVTPLWGLPTQDVPQGRAPGSYGLLWGGPHPGWVLPKGGDGGGGTGHPASYSAHRIQHLEGGAPMERYTQWDTGTPGDRVPPQRQQLWVGPPWDASPPG